MNPEPTMTKPTSTRTKKVAPETITDALGTAILRGQSWVTNADAAAIATAKRLARLLDSMFDTGEIDKIAPLLGRFANLLHELKMTPLSRDKSTATTEDSKDGSEYAETYLRLLNPTNTQPKNTGSKSGPASRRPSG